MGKKDNRVDNYIKKSADFAIPILLHLRELVQKGCPDVEETMKWSFPHFEYKGILCSMASFKQHCSFGFWKASLMKDADKFEAVGETGMGHLGKITSLKELLSDKTLLAYIKEAMRLNEEEIKLPAKPKSTEKKELIIPADMQKALSRNKKAKSVFDSFNYSNKKEYIEWIVDAKSGDTRNKRLETAIEWIAEGKVRHWKYVKK